MVRKEIRSASGVLLVFKIEGGEVEVHWPGDAALFSANDFIELGQTLSSIEQGEARDKIDDYNFQLRELGNEIQRAFEGGGGQNEA